MHSSRKPTELEIKLIKLLIEKAGVKFPKWQETLMVSEMSDGNMGSLTLFPKGYDEHKAREAMQISEYSFKDVDNVPVSAALYVDKNSGELYELDIWKVDFSPLIKINVDSLL